MSYQNLGLCRKAGRLVLGFDAVTEAVKNKTVAGVFYAGDVSPKTEKELLYYCGKYGVPIKKSEFTMDEAYSVLKKRAGVFATDESFYSMF